MSASRVRPPFVTWLYNHNPFYAISAVLMLFAVRNAYGELEIGAINCWIMMGVLAGYTALLAGIGVLIVRWETVWEDARSILVLLLILFLAVSISADDLFVNMESAAGGAVLLLCGYLFSALVTEAVLWGARIRLPFLYRFPYHLMLALFYAAPWWCSPELHPRSTVGLEWTIFSFPIAAGLLILTLLPAVRRGSRYVEKNGTPWNWPWYPWTAFGVLIAAVALRTFALSMTFGPVGPIWIPLAKGGRAISFDTMWGPYFLIPPVFAVLVLVLEAGLVTGNRKVVKRVLLAVPILLLLALPLSHGQVFNGFLRQVTETLGSPIWLAVWLQLAFYSWAWMRGAAGSGAGVLATVSLLTFVGPATLSPRTLTEPQVWPLAVVGFLLLIDGLRNRSSTRCTLAAALATVAVWLVLPETAWTGFRLTICYHLMWLAVILIGLSFHDRFAEILRMVGAIQMPLASLIAFASPSTTEIPIELRLMYFGFLATACLLIARVGRIRAYYYAFGAQLSLLFYGITVPGFRALEQALGWSAVTAMFWSVAALLLAFLISAHKARRLPPGWLAWLSNSRITPGADSAAGIEAVQEPS